MADAKKIDPFDVEALEKSLNDSATRVSTIWVSFLIFSLYLLTAATTVTHRQLFLAEPVKLPVLNIELPLWGFFWLAPILFVIFHAYVLLQLILLARTAAAYDAAVTKLAEQDNLSPEANASLRQRLANTLFAQILAGSPREREGWFGSLLRAMAWITLVIAPILILLTFQFMFLPYHSHLATWTHRLLILLEFLVAFQLWPLALDPRRDLRWPSWRWRIGDVAVRRRRGLRRLALPMAATALFILLSLSLATFPGEFHVNLFTWHAVDGVQCSRWIQQKFHFADMRFDRLALARVDVVDHEKLEKIQQATSKAGERPYQGERTRILRDRDLSCGDFSDYADLRRIDLSGAHLRNANFQFAKLEGVSFIGAELQSASLDNAQVQGASLAGAKLQGASLAGTRLQGASLEYAALQGASLEYAALQGAYLGGTELQGAYLGSAELQGARLFGSKLQGSSLDGAKLQGASLIGAELQGASLDGTELQAASLDNADLSDAVLSGAWIWRASGANCANARIIDPKTDEVITHRGNILGRGEPIPATPHEIEEFITQSVNGIQNEERKIRVSKILRERLTADPTKDNTAALGEAWRGCARESERISQKEFDGRHVAVLRGAVCDAVRNGAAVGKGIARNWISHNLGRREFNSKLARALLGEDDRPCAPAKDYDENTKALLRGAAGPPAPK